MLHDLRTTLKSKLGLSAEATDHQIITQLDNVLLQNARVWDLLKRSRVPVSKPWAEVGIGDYVCERDSFVLWTVHGKFPGKGKNGDKIEFHMTGPYGEHKKWTMYRDGMATIFEHSPLVSGAEILAAELGARCADVP